MSQAKLTLRPPPNVDFVQGFPGIPPGTDRPQAAVKGAIEVRVNPQGVKAKWVEIELRKVEVLPGGGQAGTFYDSVGSSPVRVWTPVDADYGILRPQDFPFYIRIPDSLPPTIALEKGAGIKYELVATICLKGKKRFFRRAKSTVMSTASQIVIDKHDLHSTWPIYMQHDTRHHTQDGVSLIVSRDQTCYGPGDRITVMATLRSDSLHTVVLRGYEFMLRETTAFHGPHTTSKKTTFQPKIVVISEQKVPLNTTLYGGNQNKTELTCTVPTYHTSATINSARYIDITYVLSLKALLGTGLPVVIDLPVIISNWPRAVSIQAAKRIGTTPSLSVVASNGTLPSIAASHSKVTSNTYVTRPSAEPNLQFNMVSSTGNGYAAGKPDAMGHISQPINSPFPGHHTSISQAGFSRQQSGAGKAGSEGDSSVGDGARSTTSRLTIANMGDDIPEESTPVQQTQRTPPQKVWLSAEQEKRRLYEAAKAQVDRVQGIAPQPIISPSRTPPPQALQSPGHVDAGPLMRGPGAISTPWSTAEAEKERLYVQAQEAAKRIQGIASYSPPSTAASMTSPVSQLSVGASIYQQAMSSLNQRVQTSAPQPRAPVAQYPTSEFEKTAVKRYYEAKAAASRSQGQDYTSAEPISYDALYPANDSNPLPTHSAPSSLINGHDDQPPAFSSSSSQHPILSEKERLRLHYAAQDATAAVAPPSPPPPAVFSPPNTSFMTNGSSEKEILRRKYEAEDAAATQMTTVRPPLPPPRTMSQHSTHSLPPIPRPPPPAPGSPSMPLTAAEEKARLKAHYEADAHVAPVSRPGSVHSTRSMPTTPPPLLPRPPIHYIKETQEEDTRILSQLYTMDSIPMLPEDRTANVIDGHSSPSPETSPRHL